MTMDVEEFIKERKDKEQELQKKYDNLNNYIDKLEFVYKILVTSQTPYLEWKKNNFFSNDYLEFLKAKLSKEVNSDDEFIDFIDKYLISKINNDHIGIGPLEYDDLEETTEEQQIQNNESYDKFKNENVEIIFTEDSVIIKIKSFKKAFIEDDKYIFDNLSLYLKDNDVNNIIIDIRNNGGGSDAYFKHFSCFTDETLDFHDRLYDLFLQKEIDFTWNPIPASSIKKHYNKYLLVNKEVFSTAETLAKFCKQTGYATIIGESTLGDGGGFSLFHIKLANGVYNGKQSNKYIEEWKLIGKNMGIYFSTEAPINEKGKIQFDGYFNTVPDIKCRSKDALNIALQHIHTN